MQNGEHIVEETDSETKTELSHSRRSNGKEPGDPNPHRLKAIIFSVLLLILVLTGAWWMWHRHAASQHAAADASARAGQAPVPVVDGTVMQKDVPIFLDGLGTVQAFNTVTVHVRVDGQLKEIRFVEGQDVHAGDVLARIDPDPFQTQLDQVTAKKAQDEAQLNLQRIELKRETDLVAAKIDTQEMYDQAAAQFKTAEATVKADEAAIDSAKVQLAYTTIVSPIDGRVGIRQVDTGNIIHATDASGLVVITQLRPISVVFTLPEQSLTGIHQQMAAGELSVTAVDRDNRTILGEGKLAVIDNQIDTTTGTIKLKANFPNNDLRLWPGQFVNARLLLSTRTNGIVVPAQVVQRGPDGAYVFIIKEDSTVEIRPVRVAQIDRGQALIDDGIKAGERVVVDGQYKLQASSHVKISEPGKTDATVKTRKTKSAAKPDNSEP